MTQIYLNKMDGAQGARCRLATADGGESETIKEWFELLCNMLYTLESCHLACFPNYDLYKEKLLTLSCAGG